MATKNPARIPYALITMGWLTSVLAAYVAGRSDRVTHSEESSPQTQNSIPKDSINSQNRGIPSHSSTSNSVAQSNDPQSQISKTGSPLEQMGLSFSEPGLTHLQRLQRLITALRAMTPEEAQEARLDYEERRRRGQSLDYEENFIYWGLGEVAGKETLEALKPTDPETQPSKAMARTMAAWATTDSNAAIQWFNTLEDGRFRDEMAFWVVDGLSQKDEEEGARYFSGLPTETQSHRLDNMLWLQTHGKGNDGAKTWFDHHVATARPPEPEEQADYENYQRNAFSKISHRLTSEDVAKAAEWVGSHRGSQFVDPKIVEAIYRQWSSTDQEAANKWKETFDQ